MDNIGFSFYVDIPLALALLVGFLINAHYWANSSDSETNVDLLSRLPTAQYRFTSFFITVVVACWFSDVSVFTFVLAAIFLGSIGSVVFEAQGAGGLFPFTAADLLREWAFGYPRFILSPPSDEDSIASRQAELEELLGKDATTCTPLRPNGDVTVDGQKFAASSEDGAFVEADHAVVVSSIKNGTLFVRPLCNQGTSEQVPLEIRDEST